MNTLKTFFSAVSIILLSVFLSGCVSESYSYDGYRDYGPYYSGRYSGSGIVYRTGPRMRPGDYRHDGRYDRRHRSGDPRREARHDRPERRPDSTPPRARPNDRNRTDDRRRFVRPNADERRYIPNESGQRMGLPRDRHN